MSKAEQRFKPYEDFTVQPDITSGGYIMNLRTNILVHRKWTKKNKYVPESFYQMAWFTDKPSEDFIDVWLPKAREAAEKLISKGEYTDEELIGGEFQTVKRNFNRWMYWDRQNHAVAGELTDATDVQLSDKVRANHTPPRKLAKGVEGSNK